jgi:capsular exopolysaccharide synthesis family protein
MLRRNGWVIGALTIVAMALSMMLSRVLPQQFQSEATLQIAGSDAGGSLLSKMGPLAGLGVGALGDDGIETDLGIMQSRRILEDVVDSLSLHVSLASPRIPRGEVLRVVSAPRNARPGVWVLTARDGGGYHVRGEKGPATPPATVAVGGTVRLGDVVVALTRPAEEPMPEALKIEVKPFRGAVAGVLRELEVEREKSSRLVQIAFYSTDPEISAGVVNGIAERFIRYKRETTTSDSRASATLLAEQVADYQRQLMASEEKLRGFREANRVVEPKAQAEAQIRRTAEMQGKEDLLEVERNALAQVLADAQQGSREAGSPSPYRRLASFPTFIANEGVQNTVATLTTLENERATLLARRTEAHPEVEAITTRIADLEQQLFRTGTNYLNNLDRELTSTRGALGGMATELAAIPAQDLEFARLAREQKLLTEVHTYLQTRLQEARIQGSTAPEPARILDPGLVDDEPVSPRPLINLILGMILGLAAGVAVAIGREMLDTRIRGGADAGLATEGLPVLASVPRVSESARLVARSRRALSTVVPILTEGESGPEFIDIRRDGPNVVADSFRALRTRLAAGPNGIPGVVVITSAMPGDGKSTVASNAAVAFARHGLRVLLVDGDLRGGRLHRLFRIDAAPGLSDVLSGDAPWTDAVNRTEAAPGKFLDVIPAGATTQDSTEMISSVAGAELVEALRERYDVVLIDTPPLGEAADAAVLGQYADSTLLVARTGATEREALNEAVAQLRALGVHVGGIVINAVPQSSFVGRYARAGS